MIHPWKRIWHPWSVRGLLLVPIFVVPFPPFVNKIVEEGKAWILDTIPSPFLHEASRAFSHLTSLWIEMTAHIAMKKASSPEEGVLLPLLPKNSIDIRAKMDPPLHSLVNDGNNCIYSFRAFSHEYIFVYLQETFFYAHNHA